MKLGKSITIITTGMLFAAVIAGHGSMGAAAAESTTADYAASVPSKSYISAIVNL